MNRNTPGKGGAYRLQLHVAKLLPLDPQRKFNNILTFHYHCMVQNDLYIYIQKVGSQSGLEQAFKRVKKVFNTTVVVVLACRAKKTKVIQ